MKPIPMLDIAAQHAPIRPALEAAFARVLGSNTFILGAEVEALERELADHLGARHAVACASGSDALVLGLRALDIGPGDEVITTAFSFFATAGAIARVGARPVFADVEPDTFGLDPEDVARKRTPRTRAILPVHLFGQMASMAPLLAFARAHGLPILEDAAQSIGATQDGQTAGTVGDAGILSFFPSKNLGALGDGGLVLTSNEALASRVRRLRAHGVGEDRYTHDEVGMNSRLDALQAAFLRAKWPHLEGWCAGRARVAARYDAAFQGLPGIVTPARRTGARHVFNQYTLRVARRDALAARLREAQIASAIYYPVPLHLQPCFRDLGGRPGDCPVAERLAQEVLSIPVYGELTDSDVDRVIAGVRLHAMGR